MLRIYRKKQIWLPECDGYKKHFSVRVQVLIQMSREMNCDMYLFFVDHQEAFERIRHEKLVKNIKQIEINYPDLKIIVNLYWGQTLIYEWKAKTLTQSIGKYLLASPFNLYSEKLFKEARGGQNWEYLKTVNDWTI